MKAVLSVLFALTALIFVLPAAAQDQAAKNESLILYVGPETVECTGVIPQRCLQIRFLPDGEWQNHFENIRNFEHIPGFDYALLVEKVERSPVAADQSSFFYQLVSILQATPAAEDSSFYDLFTPTGVYSIVHIAAETETCRDGFTPEIACLSITVDGETSLYNPARVSNFAYIPGSEYELVVERADLTEQNVADVPSFIYQLVQIVSETPASA